MTNIREIHDAGRSKVKKLGPELKNWDPNSFQAHNVSLVSRTQILSQMPGTLSDILASWRIEGIETAGTQACSIKKLKSRESHRLGVGKPRNFDFIVEMFKRRGDNPWRYVGAKPPLKSKHPHVPTTHRCPNSARKNKDLGGD